MSIHRSWAMHSSASLYHVVTPTAVSLYRPDDTGGAAHSCAAGHTTCDKRIPPISPISLQEALLDARHSNASRCKITIKQTPRAALTSAPKDLSTMCGCLRGGLCIVYMAEFKFKFIYNYIIICIDCL